MKLFATYFEKEFASQGIVPLVFAMMDVQGRTGSRRHSKLEDRTRAAAIFSCNFANCVLGLLLIRKREPIFAWFCDDCAPSGDGLRIQQRAYRGYSKSVEQRAAIEVRHSVRVLH